MTMEQLDRSEREKLYIRLTEIFMSKIDSGEWRTGVQIPTEEELCKSFNVSKITVRRAVDNLVMEGYLDKLQGKGTFVKLGPPRAGIPMKTTLVESVFLPDDAPNVKLLEKKKLIDMKDDVARRMGPVVERDMFYISRLKSVENVPVLVNELFIPVRVCPDIEVWAPDYGSVFEFMRDHHTPKIAKVRQSVEVGRPSGMEALLSVRPTTLCMVIHRVFISSGDVTLAYSRTTARPDKFMLESEFIRLN